MASSQISAKDEEKPTGERPLAAGFGSCPLPIFQHPQIVLGHGSGGKLTADLIDQIFLPAFKNPILDKLDDQAVVTIGGGRVSFSTGFFFVAAHLFSRGGHWTAGSSRNFKRSCDERRSPALSFPSPQPLRKPGKWMICAG